jgi:dephospho-CoA kinase
MKFAVAVCGPIASGKSTIVDFCNSELGLKVVSFGSYVRAVAKEVGVSNTRETLQELGNCLFNSKGAAGLLQGVLQYAEIKNTDSVVFDGVRHLEVLFEIRRNSKGFLAVFLHSNLHERFQRHNARSSSVISFGEFIAIDGHQVEAGISELKGHCELVIDTTRHPSEIQEVLRNKLTLIRKSGAEV